MPKELWVEKYRPKTIQDYVWQSEIQKQQVQTWIADKSIPHILFSGSAGVGKTTMAKVLINELGIESADVLEINASRNNSVDDVRNSVTNFSSTMPWGDFKVILMDEADYLSPNAQAALRGVMEQFHSVVRFILTCNYPNRIIPAIHSRCQSFPINTLDQTEFIVRLGQILDNEGVKFDVETLQVYVKGCYPDLRKTINSSQLNTIDGELQAPQVDDNSADYKLEMVSLFRDGKVKEARQLICKQVRTDEYEDIYRWLYNNLEFFGKTEDQRDEAIIIIRNGLVKHGQIADPEINLSATLVELELLTRQT